MVVEDVPMPLRAAGRDEVFVGRIRREGALIVRVDADDWESQQPTELT